MDLSKPSTRWAIFAVVLVAVVIAGVGFYASRQADYVCKPLTNAELSEYAGQVPPHQVCVSPALSLTYSQGVIYTPGVTRSAVLRPGHAAWFYAGAGAVLVLELLGLWAASAGKRGQGES